MEIGFDVPAAQKSVIAAQITTSLGSDKAGSRFGDVKVAVDGDTAILRGSVASQSDRLLAQQIALLEPSIMSIRDELAVKTPARTSAAPR